MAKNRNKVKFGLNNVHWAKITQWGADPDGTPTIPVYGESVRLPGAVSLSIDAKGENENFYADDSVDCQPKIVQKLFSQRESFKLNRS